MFLALEALLRAGAVAKEAPQTEKALRTCILVRGALFDSPGQRVTSLASVNPPDIDGLSQDTLFDALGRQTRGAGSDPKP